jgi:hypothetical protein
MASGGTTQQSSTSQPGTLSPITATLLQLFGGSPAVKGGQYQPTTYGQGGAFNAGMFSALPGLLQNQPLTPTETGIIGGAQAPAWANALGSQGILQQGADVLPALLNTNPTAAIAAANRGFSQDTLPAILERAPGFSSSDLQRETARAGVDLQTNIAALKEANLGRVGQVVQGLPAFAQAFGSNLLDQASQNLGFGQLGRQLVTDTSPAGDAFRVLTALQSLTGPSITSRGQSAGQSKQGGVLS